MVRRNSIQTRLSPSMELGDAGSPPTRSKLRRASSLRFFQKSPPETTEAENQGSVDKSSELNIPGGTGLGEVEAVTSSSDRNSDQPPARPRLQKSASVRLQKKEPTICSIGVPSSTRSSWNCGTVAPPKRGESRRASRRFSASSETPERNDDVTEVMDRLKRAYRSMHEQDETVALLKDKLRALQGTNETLSNQIDADATHIKTLHQTNANLVMAMDDLNQAHSSLQSCNEEMLRDLDDVVFEIEEVRLELYRSRARVKNMVERCQDMDELAQHMGGCGLNKTTDASRHQIEERNVVLFMSNDDYLNEVARALERIKSQFKRRMAEEQSDDV